MHRQEVYASVACITKSFMVRVNKTSGQLRAETLVSPGAASADSKLRRSFPEPTPDRQAGSKSWCAGREGVERFYQCLGAGMS